MVRAWRTFIDHLRYIQVPTFLQHVSHLYHSLYYYSLRFFCSQEVDKYLINVINLFMRLISTYQTVNLLDRATWHFLANVKNDLKRKKIWSINTCKQTDNIYSTSKHYRRQLGSGGLSINRKKPLFFENRFNRFFLR